MSLKYATPCKCHTRGLLLERHGFNYPPPLLPQPRDAGEQPAPPAPISAAPPATILCSTAREQRVERSDDSDAAPRSSATVNSPRPSLSPWRGPSTWRRRPSCARTDEVVRVDEVLVGSFVDLRRRHHPRPRPSAPSPGTAASPAARRARRGGALRRHPSARGTPSSSGRRACQTCPRPRRTTKRALPAPSLARACVTSRRCTPRASSARSWGSSFALVRGHRARERGQHRGKERAGHERVKGRRQCVCVQVRLFVFHSRRARDMLRKRADPRLGPPSSRSSTGRHDGGQRDGAWPQALRTSRRVDVHGVDRPVAVRARRGRRAGRRASRSRPRCSRRASARRSSRASRR